MPGIDDYLSGLWQAIQGNAPQAPPPAQGSPVPQGGAQPPATPQGGGLTGFLGNPLTQAALSGYLGAIGSPKRAGAGGMISAGGLDALSAYNAAEKTQQGAPLAAAKTQALQNQNQLTSAKTGLINQQSQQIAGVQQHNAALAAQINSAMPNMTPTQKQRATILANTIATDTSKAYDPNAAFTAIYQEPLKEDLLMAQTGASTAAAAKSGAETAAIPAKTALTEAETAAIGPKLAIEKEKADKTGAAKPAKETDPLTTLTKLRGLYDKEYGGFIGALEGRPSFEEYLVGKGIDPTSGHPLDKLPPDSVSYKFDSASGKVVAVDAAGKPTHYYSP